MSVPSIIRPARRTNVGIMITMHLSNTAVHYSISAASGRPNVLQLIVQHSDPRMVEDVLLAFVIDPRAEPHSESVANQLHL